MVGIERRELTAAPAPMIATCILCRVTLPSKLCLVLDYVSDYAECVCQIRIRVYPNCDERESEGTNENGLPDQEKD